MKTKNKMMITLLIISTITAGLLPVYGTTNQLSANNIQKTRVKPTLVAKERLLVNKFSTVRNAKAVDLSAMDESTINERIREAEKAAPIEDTDRPPLWYLNTYGYSTIVSPTVDAAEKRFRIHLQMVAQKVKVTEFGVVYEVYWGRVVHHGERFAVSGVALLDGDGVFYLKLDGEVAFKAIGQIYGREYGVKISMKGYLVDDGVTYSHRMRGWAIPLTKKLIPRLRNHLNK